MEPRGHEKIARAFRARGGEDRRLKLEEALRLHPRAQAVNDPPAQHDVLVQLVAAQIEEAIFEPHVLGILLIAEDRQRQLRRRAKNLDGRHIDFDEARRHFRIFGAGRALTHRTVDAHHPFRAQRFRQRKGRRIRIDDALRDPIMIAQIDEENAAVVADAVTPAGKSDFGIGLRFAQVAAGVGAITMHVLSRRMPGARRRAKISID